ncbi:kinase-like domain-containing protein [Mycena metata]|uniref:Kinase-like domain-containing protein n=1 Tax=Mycena metata TaxID=1033252 RepID=A0AAD7MIX3_9AGAR|nr:kinase-like domain-containing protein [Mycena metata]
MTSRLYTMPHPSNSAISRSFAYQSQRSWSSWLWSAWLLVPQSLRYRTYCALVRSFGKQQHMSPVYSLPLGIYVKFCRLPDEGLVMEYVRTRTTIPVPQVLDHITATVSFEPDNRMFLLVMHALPGTPLFIQGEGSRLAHATDEQRNLLETTIAEWIFQLRALPPPNPHLVSGFTGGPFISYRIGDPPVGPFADVAEFHAQPFCAVSTEDADERIQSLVAERAARKYYNHLTHGDLLPHNILTDHAYHPTGLIDWECAGWLPEYWELASSTRAPFERMYIWRDMYPRCFPRYDDDLTLELHIQRYWDP